MLKSVLSSWIETLSSGHLDAGFGMIRHVQEILAESEEGGLDVTGAKAFVDEIIALGQQVVRDQEFSECQNNPLTKDSLKMIAF